MGDHQKRLTAPEPWGIAKKEYKFITKTAPGAHNTQALPLAVWVRDQMGFARTLKEVKKILNDRQVIVNGRVCKDPRSGIGLFDVVSMPALNKHFLILRDNKGKIVAKEIPPEQAHTRLCKVKSKTVVRDGKVQLNLRDGANLLSDAPVNPHDSIVVTLGSETDPSVPRFTIVEHYPMSTGNYAMVIGGRHRGRMGKIVAIEQQSGNNPTRVLFEDGKDGTQFETIQRYVFMIGTTAEAASRWGSER
ncbi:MAG: 30S ribosomal protein S4e [Methanomicrobiales archaeon]|nr:30S ribosomal protein S4e [Methanomicrobiales archaeon]